MKPLFKVWCVLFVSLAPCLASDINPEPAEIFIKKYNLSTDDYEDLWALPVVHATHVWPKDGVLKPGKCASRDLEEGSFKIKKGELLEGPMGWRPTLHWALGGVAPDSSENTLSDRPYAIITTLKELLPQLVSIQTDELVILGEFKLPQKSTIVVKAGLERKEDPWIKDKGIDVKTFGSSSNNKAQSVNSSTTRKKKKNNHRKNNHRKQKNNKGINSKGTESLRQTVMDNVKCLTKNNKLKSDLVNLNKLFLDIEQAKNNPKKLKPQDVKKLETQLNSKIKENEIAKKVKTLINNIPYIEYAPHARHPTQIIEKLIPYLCIEAFGQEPNAIIKDIGKQSKELYDALHEVYRLKLLNKDKENQSLAEVFRSQNINLQTSIEKLKSPSYDPKQLYKLYIGDNTDENMKVHKENFSQWYIKAKYHSDEKWRSQTNRTIKVNGEIIAQEKDIAKHIAEWFS